ncbi:IS4 family transposase [Legionella shakespearei]|nr:IS4 family transposase [Legionella shakespearei]
MSEDWVEKEVEDEDFGDKRLNKRFKKLLGSLFKSPDKSISGSCKGWDETMGAYRFIGHHKVTPSKILSAHRESTVSRIREQGIVLIAQDSSEVDYSGHDSKVTMGYLTQKNSRGFYMHPSIAFTPERCCLGTVDLQLWTRQKLGTRGDRKTKGLEEKETYCWLKGYEAANEVAKAAPDTMIISISDREGDIYEVLENEISEDNHAYWLVRCQHDRKVFDEKAGAFNVKLKQAIASSDVKGHIEFEVPSGYVHRNSKARHKRKGRLVKQEIRFNQVTLSPPKRPNTTLKPTSIYVVHAKEIDVPEGEKAIEWYLLTSVPIQTAEQATTLVNWYLCRWQIEVFFKVLKSGCQIEELQFETFRSTANCLALYMIVAWRILFLTMMGRACPELGCDIFFEECEWKAVYAVLKKTKPPQKPPTLHEMIIMIAKLGGFLARKSDGFPGPKVMWQGLQRMRDFSMAWITFHAMDEN